MKPKYLETLVARLEIQRPPFYAAFRFIVTVHQPNKSCDTFSRSTKTS